MIASLIPGICGLENCMQVLNQFLPFRQVLNIASISVPELCANTNASRSDPVCNLVPARKRPRGIDANRGLLQAKRLSGCSCKAGFTETSQIVRMSCFLVVRA